MLEIKTSNGMVGYGQALPRAYLTGEDIDGAEQDIRNRWWPRLREIAIPVDAGISGAMQVLNTLYLEADAARLNASYAAVDIAALDAFARSAGLPLFGREHAQSIPLVAALPASSPGKAAWLARILKWLGYRHLKVKVGRNESADDARIAAVRRAVGSSVRLDADANGAWEWGEAVERLRSLRRHGIVLVEEPLTRAASACADYRYLEDSTGVATMVDESLCTLEDALALLERGTSSWWNIRLAKNGGFSGFKALADLASRHSVGKYGGVLVGETGALAAAGRAAFFANRVACGEYGFPRIFLKRDPFRGAPSGYMGSLNPPAGEASGLGIFAQPRVMAGLGKSMWSSERG